MAITRCDRWTKTKIHGDRLMDEKALAAQLVSEGFSRTYVWEDEPGVQYPEHVHRMETAHIILSGEMTLTMDGKAQTYRVGERCDVSAARFIRRKWGRGDAGT